MVNMRQRLNARDNARMSKIESKPVEVVVSGNQVDMKPEDITPETKLIKVEGFDMTDLNNTVVRIDERTKTMQVQLDQVHTVIYGNGEEGLVSRVTRTESQYETLCKITGVALAIIGVAVTILGYVAFN